ncbi:alpha/beta hydrolase [Microbispora sp. NEAU-D428]|nr:alpha/beta hydrolase [Microbispora sitophila]
MAARRPRVRGRPPGRPVRLRGLRRLRPVRLLPERYSSLQGYAQDVLDICAELDLTDAVFVGHSVSAMIGAPAAVRAGALRGAGDGRALAPLHRRRGLRRRLQRGRHRGTAGVARQQLSRLVQRHGPGDHGQPGAPRAWAELTNSFCRTDPDIAKRFATVTFMSDNRADLSRVPVRSLILQCSEDVIAPVEVGKFVHENIPAGELVLMRATGHCPNLSAPEETIAAIKAFL